jgi:hypothetical protein
MAATQNDSPRFSLYTWGSSSDDFTREQMTLSHQNVESYGALFLTSGGAPSVTSTATERSLFWDSVNSHLYFRGTTGTAWTRIPFAFGAGIVQITAGAASSGGSGFDLARANHVHDVSTAAASSLGSTNAEGSSSSLARADHIHTIAAGHIVNSMVSASAAIDGSKISGAVATASAWATGRTITLSGDASGSVLISGAADVTLAVTVLDDSHTHTTLQPIDADLTALAALSTTGIVARTASNTYVPRSIATSGTGISISNGDLVSGNATITLNSDTTATINTIVLRDSAGRFRAVDPSHVSDVATKNYTDTADALKANSADVYTKTAVNNAKLYQYGNNTSGQGVGLPSDAARTTPRIYVQAAPAPTYPAGQVAVTGDIWFEI